MITEKTMRRIEKYAASQLNKRKKKPKDINNPLEFGK